MTYKLTWNKPKIPTLKATFEWNPEGGYAPKVHNGSFGTDHVRVFPRPWVYKTVEQFINVPQVFRNNYLESKNFTEAFVDTTEDLNSAFREAIQAPIYYYPTKTYRKNGEVVTSPRDIVDTAELLDSQDYFFH